MQTVTDKDRTLFLQELYQFSLSPEPQGDIYSHNRAPQAGWGGAGKLGMV